MTSKPPAKPAKPAIHAGTPEGTPFPRSLDRLAEANQVLADMARQHNEMAAHGEAAYSAAHAAQRVQAFRRGGYPELPDVPQPTGEKYRNQAIFETSDKRSWIQLGMFNPTTGTADGPIGRRGEAVTYVDIEIADVKFVDVIEWNQVTDTELKVMRDQAEKDAADLAEIQAAREAAQKILAKAKRHVWTSETNVHMGWNEATLDMVEELVAATHAKVVPTGVEGLVVSAAKESELVAMIPPDAPRFTIKQINGHDARVAQLVHCLNELEGLAVAWARLGKKPAADDDGKLLANRLGPNKIFVH